ncbi:MAG: hypothetical protein AAFY88_20645, partial [Acidobacteriota bacterium]
MATDRVVEVRTAGGGGRIAVRASDLLGFDPAIQLDASGGTDLDHTVGGHLDGGRAGAGTVFFQTAASTYGDLRVDARETAGQVPDRTVLPSLGEHTVGVADVDVERPTDLWIEPQDPAARFDLGVEGVWARVNGVDYPITEEAGDRRRVLLEGAAGAVHVGDEVRGVYKFDHLYLSDGAGLDSFDAIEVAELSAAGAVGLDALPTVSGDFIVGDGAVLEVEQPVVGQRLRVDDGGVLTAAAETTLRLDFSEVDVQAGGAIDVSAKGYVGGGVGIPGGGWTDARGHAPEGASGSLEGGTHGGNGRNADGSGEAFGSVKRPRFAGGGSGEAHRCTNCAPYEGGAGGGVLEIVAQTLTLDGALRANGGDGEDDKKGGAGGTVYVEATNVAGIGAIEARGADGEYSAGGGGRVALVTDSLTLDPTTQVQADSFGDGGSGTIYVRTAASTWGDLHLHGEAPDLGTEIGYTRLPALGEHEIGAVTVDVNDPANLWIEVLETQDGPSLGVEGQIALVQGAGFEILDQVNLRHLLLDGAAG